MLSLPLPSTSEIDVLEKQEDEEVKANLEKCLRPFPLFQEYVTRKKIKNERIGVKEGGNLQLVVNKTSREYPFLEKARKYISKLSRSRLFKIAMETKIPLKQMRSLPAIERDHDKLMTYLAEEMDTTPLEMCSFTPSLYSFQDIWDCCIGNPSFDPKLKDFTTPPVIVHENWNPSVTSTSQRKLFLRFPLYRSNESVLSVFDRVGSGSTVKFFNDGDVVDAGNLPYQDAALGKECEAILASGNRELLLDFVSQHGCPASLRCHIWQKLLPHDGKLFFELDEDRYILIQEAQKSIQTTQYLTDLIMRLDVKNMANEDSFFVFEDLVSYIMLLWARDNNNSNLMKFMEQDQSCVDDDDDGNDDDGVEEIEILPYDQLYLYILPLCYIEHDVPTLYATFRDMYTR